jgi:hypothetical protein
MVLIFSEIVISQYFSIYMYGSTAGLYVEIIAEFSELPAEISQSLYCILA